MTYKPPIKDKSVGIIDFESIINQHLQIARDFALDIQTAKQTRGINNDKHISHCDYPTQLKK